MIKQITYTNEKQLEGLRQVAKIIDCGLALMIQSAINEVYSAYALLSEDKRLFRHETAKYAKLTTKACDRKRTLILSLMRDKRFCETFFDSIVEESESDITMFRIALKQELDNCRVQHSLIFSYVECARVMLDMCVHQFDELMKRVRIDYRIDWRKDFEEFNAADLLASWNRVCDMLYADCSANLNTPRVEDAFKRLSGNFGAMKYSQRCIDIAEKEHPRHERADIQTTGNG